MGEVKLVITPDADDDIRAIYDYLSEYSINAALAQVGRFLEFFELLRKFPRLGKVIDKLRNERLREFYIGAYRVAYYIVSEEQIDILRVHHSARPPEFE
jgi:plasmid stabilization system protein ParE